MEQSSNVTEDFAVGLGATIIGLIVFGIIVAIGLIGREILKVFAANIVTVAIILGVIIGCALLFIMFALFGRFVRQSMFNRN